MKTYKYSTKERAERVAKSLGCSGSHYHNENGERKYMPCKDMKTFKEKTKKEQKGEEKEVTLRLSKDAFKYYDTNQKKWVLQKGSYHIELGCSQDDAEAVGKNCLLWSQALLKVAN